MRSVRMHPDLGPGDIVAGDAKSRGRDLLKLGTLIESGAKRHLWLDVSGEQVVGIFGKRGTGKSYSLGVLLEGMAAGQGETPISAVSELRAALVIDVMGIFWSSQIPLTESGTPEIQKQARYMQRDGLSGMNLNVTCWIPGGFQEPSIDPPSTQTFEIRASDLTVDDWGGLFDFDMYGEPRGMLITELLQRVLDGYEDTDGTRVPAQIDFSIADLLTCLDSDPSIDQDFGNETLRSVRQRLRTFSRLAVFSGSGTSLVNLLQRGRASVLLLNRVPDELRKVIVAVLLRNILKQRGDASMAQKRLDLDASLDDDERACLQKVVDESVPRTWVLVDEGHTLASKTERSVAREMLVKYAKEGRNYGLSLAVATQQPAVLDRRLTSQIESLICHQLTSYEDAAVATKGVRSPLPTELVLDGESAQVSDLIRRLGQGEAIFSSGNAPTLPRLVAFRVRSRVTAHGGYEA